MVAHLLPDEKFMDVAIRQFESVAPGRHLWVVLGKRRKLTHIRSDRIRFLSRWQVIRLLRGDVCEGLILHSMNDRFLPLLKWMPAHKRVIWIGWGYDYYSLLIRTLPPESLYFHETAEAMKRKPADLLLKDRFRKLANLLLGHHSWNPRKDLRRVDFFSPVLDSEFDLAKADNPAFQARHIGWNYGTLEDDYQPSEDVRMTGRNILLGNSATPENNHIDTLMRLADSYEVEGRTIITPLSYGDPWYADRVAAFGENLFGSQFRPLRAYLDRDAYHGILSTCGHAFMNHVRQQAFGNIAYLLLAGTTVHMNSNSPLYRWLVDRGVRVLDIPSEPVGTRLPLAPLSDSEGLVNASVMRSHWSRASQDRKTAVLIETAVRPRSGAT